MFFCWKACFESEVQQTLEGQTGVVGKFTVKIGTNMGFVTGFFIAVCETTGSRFLKTSQNKPELLLHNFVRKLHSRFIELHDFFLISYFHSTQIYMCRLLIIKWCVSSGKESNTRKKIYQNVKRNKNHWKKNINNRTTQYNLQPSKTAKQKSTRSKHSSNNAFCGGLNSVKSWQSNMAWNKAVTILRPC